MSNIFTYVQVVPATTDLHSILEIPTDKIHLEDWNHGIAWTKLIMAYTTHKTVHRLEWLPVHINHIADGLRTKPRTIVCCQNDWKQKEEILCAARQTKPTGLLVMKDLAVETLDKPSSQHYKLKEAKRARKIAYFVLDSLIIKDRPPFKSR